MWCEGQVTGGGWTRQRGQRSDEPSRAVAPVAPNREEVAKEEEEVAKEEEEVAKKEWSSWRGLISYARWLHSNALCFESPTPSATFVLI